jgi:TonB family protein
MTLLKKGTRMAFSLSGHVLILTCVWLASSCIRPIRIDPSAPRTIQIQVQQPAPVQQVKKPPKAVKKKPTPPVQKKRPVKPVTKDYAHEFKNTVKKTFEDIDSSIQKNIDTRSTPQQQQPSEHVKQRLHAVTTLQDFTEGWYLDLICTKISNAWIEPEVVVLKDKPVYNVVSFRIQRNGTISAGSVKKSSKSTVFDQSTLTALTSASPLPAIPKEFTGNYLEINLTFKLER